METINQIKLNKPNEYKLNYRSSRASFYFADSDSRLLYDALASPYLHGYGWRCNWHFVCHTQSNLELDNKKNVLLNQYQVR